MKLCSGAFLRNDGRYPEKKSVPPPNPSALKKRGLLVDLGHHTRGPWPCTPAARPSPCMPLQLAQLRPACAMRMRRAMACAVSSDE